MKYYISYGSFNIVFSSALFLSAGWPPSMMSRINFVFSSHTRRFSTFCFSLHFVSLFCSCHIWSQCCLTYILCSMFSMFMWEKQWVYQTQPIMLYVTLFYWCTVKKSVVSIKIQKKTIFNLSHCWFRTQRCILDLNTNDIGFQDTILMLHRVGLRTWAKACGIGTKNTYMLRQ